MRALRFAFSLIFLVLIAASCAQHQVPPRIVATPPPEVRVPLPSSPVASYELLRPAPNRVRELRARIERILNSYGFEHVSLGMKIVSLDNNELLFEKNSHQLLMPASNMKIVTAAAALLRLGPEFRYETTLQTDGEVVNGSLNGNLIVIGTGDPTISSRMQGGDALATFRDWSDALREQGIRRIDGSIIGVDTYFDDQRVAYGWPPNSFNSPYAAEVSALQFNDNVVAVYVKGSKSGRLASVRLDPYNRYFRIQNRVITRSGHSNRFVAYRAEGSNTIILRGRIGTRDQTDVRYITVHEPAGYFSAVLKETLEKNGIRVREYRRATRDEGDGIRNNPDRYRVLYTHQSQPLRIILTEMMKSSQNLFADSLAKTISAMETTKGSFSGAQQAIRKTLASFGFPSREFVMEDGSGLSSYNFVSANLLVQILAGMYQHPAFEHFYKSFPIAGVDGTLKNRMIGTAAEGNVRAKTGFIGSARSLSGYVTTRDGEHVAFAMLANNFTLPLSGIDSAQEQICIELARFSRK
jgi:serine-type D-Ala-D-Ala carboxypeptidase/endopeptidase (penicillin-binding protein 4)